jgi:hypothetical protein
MSSHPLDFARDMKKTLGEFVTSAAEYHAFLLTEATSAVPDKELYEWISVIVLSNSVSKEFLQGS